MNSELITNYSLKQHHNTKFDFIYNRASKPESNPDRTKSKNRHIHNWS